MCAFLGHLTVLAAFNVSFDSTITDLLGIF